MGDDAQSSRWVLNVIKEAFYKRDKEVREVRRHCDNTSRNWCDVATSQAVLVASTSYEINRIDPPLAIPERTKPAQISLLAL